MKLSTIHVYNDECVQKVFANDPKHTPQLLAVLRQFEEIHGDSTHPSCKVFGPPSLDQLNNRFDRPN